MKETNRSSPVGSSLNTLAQSATGISKNNVEYAIIVGGQGSDLTDQKSLKARAKRKLVTQKLTLSLIDVVKRKEEFDRLQSYWNTYHCQNRIYVVGSKLHGQYCKNRWCTLCCSIRKAVLINRYLPEINTWPDVHFVTLTAKSLGVRKLKKRLGDMNRGFAIITKRNRKRAQRGNGIKLIGVKSLECNFNPEKKTYNPHLHLIVATKQMAELIVTEWLAICTTQFAKRSAQNIQKVTDKEGILIEVIKYGCKIFTEPDVKNDKSLHVIYAAGLDNIFSAMKGIRIFERFGFNVSKCNTPVVFGCRAETEYEQWDYEVARNDWFNAELIPLTQYTAPNPLIDLLENRIDKEAE